MTAKKWLRYLIYGIAVVAFICLAGIFEDSDFIKNFEKKFLTNITFYIFIAVFFIFGLFIGLEHLINEIGKKKAKWQFNVPRFVLVGIPAFLIALSMPIYYLVSLAMYFPQFIKNSYSFSFFGAAVFGYILISNFKRKEIE